MHAPTGINIDSDVKQSGKPRLRIRNCSLLDPEVPQRIRRNVDILIVGPSIRAIVPTGSTLVTENEQSLDGTHRLAVPGLVNANTHSPENLLRGETAGKVSRELAL